MFVCQICNLFGGSTFSAVLRHMGEIHRYDPGLVIRCGLSRCPQTYSNYESFRSHVYRKHREMLHSQSSIRGVSMNNPESTGDTEEHNNNHEHWDDELMVQTEVDIKKIGAKFLLKTREEYRIAQLTLNKIIGDMKGLWMSSIEAIREEVKKSTCNSDADGDLMKSLDHSFPLIGLETEHMQLKYYKEHFNYLVSVNTS